MKTKLLAAGLLGALSLAGTTVPAFADGEEAAASPWSATLAVTSDYRFRGVTQSDKNAALQGSIDFASESGFFAGIWASSIDFVDDGIYTDGDTGIEVDLYAGYTHAFSDAMSGTIKVVYYAYPDADYLPGVSEYDYFEVIASLGHDFGGASVTAEIAWSPDYFFQSSDGVATTGTLAVPLCDKLWFFDGGLSASGHAGYQWIDDNINYGTPDYFFFDAGLSASAGMFTLDVRWVDTDLDEAECFGGLDWCEGGVVVTGSLKFGG